MLLSSLEVRLDVSTILGLGESFDGVPVLSDSERVLDVIGDRNWAAVGAASAFCCRPLLSSLSIITASPKVMPLRPRGLSMMLVLGEALWRVRSWLS
jgi:hypothetical protein